MEEEKAPNISRTRIGDLDGGGSYDHPASNFEQVSLDDELYGGGLGVAAAGDDLDFGDEAYKAASRNQQHKRESSFQEIAGLGAGVEDGRAPGAGPAQGPDDMFVPYPGSQGSREDVSGPVATTDQSGFAS